MHALAVDFGGTRIKIGVIRSGQMISMRVVDAESQKGLSPRLPVILQSIRDACTQCGVDLEKCAGIGMAFPCLIDYRSGRISSAIDKYPDAIEIDLPTWSRTSIGLPLVLENDAHAALAGEWQFGAGRGYCSVVLLT